MKILPAWRTRIFQAVEAALFVLVLSILFLVALQVFTRYVLQAAVPWTEEVARMALVWTVMLGAAVSMERKAHYAISFLAARMRGRTKVVVTVATDLMGVTFLAVLAVSGTEYVLANLQNVFVATGISRSAVYVAVPLGAALMAFSLITHSLDVLFESTSPAEKAPERTATTRMQSLGETP